MADLHISKKTIQEFFTEVQNKKIIIPDYQRPYKWNTEKCETLWNDIENFAQTDAKIGGDYFLGTIVSYTNDYGNHEIIDGQQRITSFTLLLRAFYRKLEEMNEDKVVSNLKNKIAPCIWKVDDLSNEITDKKDIHICSEVATEEDNDTFHKILETGYTSEEKKDNYSVNYRFFLEKCNKYAMDNPLQWKELCVAILGKCVILPIKCNTQDTALTIFSTLNDRGLPLADSDIFKAQIYKNYSEEERCDFTEKWKELTEICSQGKDNIIDSIFRYYTHILRARKGDYTKEIGLRKFYAQDKYERLKAPNLMSEIMDLALFWRYINYNIEPDGVKYLISDESRKYLQCLNHYPNEYWKYVVSVFFTKNKQSDTFDVDFQIVLKSLVAFLFVRFIENPTVNAIKDDIFNFYIRLNDSNELKFNYIFNEDLLKQRIENFSSSRISRALLLLDAYLNPNQEKLIHSAFEIEHIFPRKWQDTNYNGWEKKEANLYLEKFGNKVIFEKKLNIQAGNGYFGNKKNRYKESKIANVQDLFNYPKNDWIKEDIEIRENEFKERLIAFFKVNLE
ncbi:DUF262 domain-containing protein [Bergeyella zoohelcum]|uniref:Uncharacterized conserved protein n=1 Tax=Bergeyella zoohelcum TaxID=1015 RepID=A0A380ZVG9_9FLAO|nr:DUF262 domain-containing protein [Bergeyella zoohelcum]EKB59225.1 hypothetical protein HMPREF9700_01702 [Bergeyella zoohelcum CCUG 30536]SUV53293.1 Uncharacterized conserved protein [Bergeyella zoohelcum]